MNLSDRTRREWQVIRQELQRKIAEKLGKAPGSFESDAFSIMFLLLNRTAS